MTLCVQSVMVVLCIVMLSLKCDSANPNPKDVVMKLGQSAFGAQRDRNGPLALSSRGTFIAISSSVPATVDIYTISDGLLWGSVLAIESEFSGNLAFSPDETWLAMADGVQTVIVWNLWTRREMCRWACDSAKSVAFGPGNEWIAIGGKQSVELRSFPKGTLLGSFAAADVNFPEVKVSSDGKRLLALTSHPRSRYAMWNIESRKLLTNQVASPDNASMGNSIRAVSDDLAMLVTGWSEGRTHSIQSVSLTSGEAHRWGAGTDQIWPYAEVAIVGSRGIVYCQRSRVHPRIEEFTINGRPTGRSEAGFECPLDLLRASQDGSVLVGRSDHRLWVFDLPSLRLRDYCRGPGAVVEIAFAKESQIVATMGTHGAEPILDDEPDAVTDAFDAVRFWSSTTGKLLHSEPGWHGPLVSESGDVALIWQNDGHLRWIELGTFATKAEAWIAQSDQGGMVVVPHEPHRSLQVWVSMVDASGNLDRIAFLTTREGGRSVYRRRVLLWNRETDRIHEVALQNPEGMNSEIHAGNVTLSRDGTLLAFKGIQSLDEAPFVENRIGIWKTNGTDPVEWFPEDDGGIVSLALSTDSKYLAVLSTPIVSDGSDTLQVWELSSRRKQVYARSPPGRPQESDGVLNDQVIPLAISPDNQWIAVGGPSGRIDVWSRSSRTFSKVIVGHRGPVWSLSFSHDGTRLASGGRDGTTLIWKWPLE